LGNNAERVWEWWLKDLRRCELHLRLFLRQTAVVVDADERGGGFAVAGGLMSYSRNWKIVGTAWRTPSRAS
jgi:hypothetical protein